MKSSAVVMDRFTIDERRAIHGPQSLKRGVDPLLFSQSGGAMQAPIVLGWREWVALPELGIARVRAKVDSGARTCALHVDEQWRFSEGGAPWVGFRLTPSKARLGGVEVRAPIHDEREVVDSGGHRTVRVFLRTVLRLAGQERAIEINLSDRRGMMFPMLLGRTALDGIFIIDPARSFLHGRPPRTLSSPSA